MILQSAFRSGQPHHKCPPPPLRLWHQPGAPLRHCLCHLRQEVGEGEEVSRAASEFQGWSSAPQPEEREKKSIREANCLKTLFSFVQKNKRDVLKMKAFATFLTC